MTDVVLEPSDGSEGFDPEVCYWCGALAFGYALLEADSHSPLASCGKLHCGYSYATHSEVVTRSLDAVVGNLVATLEAEGSVRAGLSLEDEYQEITWPQVSRALMLYGPELSREPGEYETFDDEGDYLANARMTVEAARPGSVVDMRDFEATRKQLRTAWRTEFR